MKPCVILVDGMSIANRNSVAKAIEAQFPKDQVERYECNDETPSHLYIHMMKDALEGSKSVIIENGWRADSVLEQMGEKFKTVKQFRRMLDRVALAVNAQVAYCVADSRTYAKNWAHLKPDVPYERVAQMIERMARGWEVLDSSGLPVTKINTSDDLYTYDIEILIERAQIKAKSNKGPGIGNWEPGKVVLLVGDRHGPSIQPYRVDWNLAFCDMAKAGSSYWLSDQLDKGEISEKHLYWINAFNSSDEATNPSFIEYLKPVSVLSLGDIAARWCQINHIRYEPFKHPQFHKRFQFNEPYPMIDRLRQLVSELE